MKIEEIEIGKIKPYKNNPRINENAIPKVAESIKKYGFKNPIIIDKDNVIVCGHTRIKAIQSDAELTAKYKTVPCIIASDLTPKQIKEFRLVENRTNEYAEWDMNQVLNELKELGSDLPEFDFNMEEINKEIDNYEAEEDNYDLDKEVPTRVKKGQIWKLGNHRLMCGDSTNEEDVAKLMTIERERERADLVITDPPYNVDYASKNKMLNYSDKGALIQKEIENDAISNFGNFLDSSYKNMVNNTKEGGAFYIWHNEKESVLFTTKLLENNVYVHQTLIWVKNNMVIGRMDYQPRHECCLYGWKQGAGHYFINDRTQKTVFEDKNIEEMKKEELVELLKSIYENSSVINEDKPLKSELHPTMKPIPLIARLMKNSSKPGEKVLDLFGGSGTTLICAEQLNRQCFMMEYDPYYCDVIIQRFIDFKGSDKDVKLIKDK